MDSIYEAYGIGDNDTSDDDIGEVAPRPSEIVLKQKPLNTECIYDTDSDSDDYDENNILAVSRRRKSFIRNSLTRFSISSIKKVLLSIVLFTNSSTSS